MTERSRFWLMTIGIAIVLCFVLAGCSFVEPTVLPDGTVLPSPLDLGLGAAAAELQANAPENPADWNAWLTALGVAVAGGGTVAWRAWRKKQTKPTTPSL